MNNLSQKTKPIDTKKTSTLKDNLSSTIEKDNKLSLRLKKNKESSFLSQIENNDTINTSNIHKCILILFTVYIWSILYLSYNELGSKAFLPLAWTSIFSTVIIAIFFKSPVNFNELSNNKGRMLIFLILYFILCMYLIPDVIKIRGHWNVASFYLPFFTNSFTFSPFSYFYLIIFYLSFLGYVTSYSNSYEKYKLFFSASIKHSKSFIYMFIYWMKRSLANCKNPIVLFL